MKFKWHFIIAIIVIHILWWFIQDLKYGYVWLIIFFTIIPDVDLKFKQHRSWLFHSILLPIFALLWTQDIFIVMIIFSMGLHLILDLKGKRRQGYWCITITKKKRLNGRNSFIWLLGNGLVSCIILIIYLVV